MSKNHFLEIHQDDIVQKIIEPFMGDMELLVKMFKSIKVFDKEHANMLEEQSRDNNNIYDMLRDIIFQHVYHYIYTEPIIENISLHDIASDNTVINNLIPEKRISIV